MASFASTPNFTDYPGYRPGRIRNNKGGVSSHCGFGFWLSSQYKIPEKHKTCDQAHFENKLVILSCGPKPSRDYKKCNPAKPTKNLKHKSPLRVVDREGWGSGVVNPTPFDQTIKRPISKTIARAIAATSTLTLTKIRIGIAMPFPVYGAANQKRLRIPGMDGDLPLLHPYRRGARYHGSLAPQPLVTGPFWGARRGVRGQSAVSHGPSAAIDSTTKGIKQSISVPHSKTVRFQHPFYRTGRRFSVPACLRQTHNHYHRYLRNVSHLKLHNGGAPTSRPVANMTGRFFRCRNSLSEIRKIFSGIGK